MSKSIAIVTHCWSVPLTQYSTMLRYQIGSLLQTRPAANVEFWLCYSLLDRSTSTVLREAWQSHHPGIDFIGVALEPARLFRRAIGRNRAAKETKADVVWNCDVDYVFGPGCIDSVVAQVKPDDSLCCPRGYMIQKDHESGDAMIANAVASSEPWPVLDPSLFEQRRRTHAIGGIQIVGGRTANKIGYCAGRKWQRPVDPSRGFSCYRDDVAFRRDCHNFKAGKSIAVTNLFRIRHSDNGRDYSVTGEKRP